MFLLIITPLYLQVYPGPLCLGHAHACPSRVSRGDGRQDQQLLQIRGELLLHGEDARTSEDQLEEEIIEDLQFICNSSSKDCDL